MLFVCAIVATCSLYDDDDDDDDDDRTNAQSVLHIATFTTPRTASKKGKVHHTPLRERRWVLISLS